MKRREFMSQSASFGVVIAAGSLAIPAANAKKLTPPAKGKIPVAFTISEGVTVIDFAGPWEVFQDVMITSRGSNHDDHMPFQLYTVAETTSLFAAQPGSNSSLTTLLNRRLNRKSSWYRLSEEARPFTDGCARRLRRLT